MGRMKITKEVRLKWDQKFDYKVLEMWNNTYNMQASLRRDEIQSRTLDIDIGNEVVSLNQHQAKKLWEFIGDFIGYSSGARQPLKEVDYSQAHKIEYEIL